MPFRVAVLTVSDTAAENRAADLSGPTIRDIVSSTEGYSISDTHCCIVPDEKEAIVRIVTEHCSSGEIDWIVTTGGTGFGVRDVTPEAISSLIERPASGLVHLILASSLQHTPFAALSRPVAGTLKNTLITTLPGSVKAVKENMSALLQGGLISHALDLIKGNSGRQLHAQLQSGDPEAADAPVQTHHHHHHHHHHHEDGEHHAPKPRSKAALSHDPSAPVTARLRKSAFQQISLEDAFSLIKEKVERLQVVTLPVDTKLIGHILAEDVYALHDIPSTSTTSVDGYALRSTDPPGTYKVLTAQTHKISNVLPPNSIYRVNTGGPIPAGADTVIMVEDTDLVSVQPDLPTGEEEREVKTLVQVPSFENVRKPGSDAKKGELVMRSGEKITRGGGEIGTLAFVGKREVKVYKRPVVAVLSTGNEIVDLQAQDNIHVAEDVWGGIYDTNRPSLSAALENMGYEVLDLGIVNDDVFSHLSAIKKGIDEADILVTTGGTSMGPTDLLKPVIERHLGGVIHFGRVGAKPGKPTTFASVPGPKNAASEEQRWKPIFALPGNPASALVTFYVFVIPALRMMGGWPRENCELPKVIVQIQNAMPLDPRVEFHRVVIKSSLLSSGNAAPGPTVVALKAYSTGGQRSSRATSLCKANGLVILPPLSKDKSCLNAGELAQALVIGEFEME